MKMRQYLWKKNIQCFPKWTPKGVYVKKKLKQNEHQILLNWWYLSNAFCHNRTAMLKCITPSSSMCVTILRCLFQMHFWTSKKQNQNVPLRWNNLLLRETTSVENSPRLVLPSHNLSQACGNIHFLNSYIYANLHLQK